MDNAKDNDNKTNRTPLEELLDRLRKSGMEVTNVTRPGRAIGILGRVRQLVILCRPRERPRTTSLSHCLCQTEVDNGQRILLRGETGTRSTSDTYVA